MIKRSVHGGEDSHLSIEVSAVRGWPDCGCQNSDAEPEKANAIGIYVRNPLAFHIDDFEVSDPECVWDDIADAFRRADALADHLGCKVVSRLPRTVIDQEGNSK